MSCSARQLPDCFVTFTAMQNTICRNEKILRLPIITYVKVRLIYCGSNINRRIDKRCAIFRTSVSVSVKAVALHYVRAAYIFRLSLCHETHAPSWGRTLFTNQCWRTESPNLSSARQNTLEQDCACGCFIAIIDKHMFDANIGNATSIKER